ncbi:MAG TPA: ribbon-helix-helix protein, CopG family [Terriglobales bacterium]|nr:ribbon-helix-helix protein, CopG family [Terriglobales bacterium]
MAQSKVLTLRLDPKLSKQLDKLADASQRSRSFLIAEAVREYVALNQWQIDETRKAIEEADRGDFASDQEVQQTLRKWKRRAS